MYCMRRRSQEQTTTIFYSVDSKNKNIRSSFGHQIITIPSPPWYLSTRRQRPCWRQQSSWTQERSLGGRNTIHLSCIQEDGAAHTGAGQSLATKSAQSTPWLRATSQRPALSCLVHGGLGQENLVRLERLSNVLLLRKIRLCFAEKLALYYL